MIETDVDADLNMLDTSSGARPADSRLLFLANPTASVEQLTCRR